MRIFCLSGGGSRLFFQMCALAKHLAENPHITADTPALWAGVSAGAIASAFLAQYRDPRVGVLEFRRVLSTLTTRKVYRPHGYGFFPVWFVRFFQTLSLYSTAPLRAFLKEHIDPARIRDAGNQCRVGIYNYETWEYEEIGETSPDLLDAVLASASYPFAFPPQRIRGRWYGDGGIKNNLPVLWAKTLPQEKHPNNVDLFLTSSVKPVSPPPFRWSFWRLAEMIVRAFEREAMIEDFRALRSALPKTTFTLHTPLLPLSGHLLTFDEDVRRMWESVPVFRIEWSPEDTLDALVRT